MGTDGVPYQVAIVVHSNQSSLLGLYCGGSIRDTRHIITAAHCVFDNEHSAEGQPVAPSSIDIVAGTRDLFGYDGGGTRMSVSDVSLDEDYDPASFSHDAAILTLSGSLQLGPRVEQVELADADTWAAAQPGTTATVTGWGETTGNDPGNPSLPKNYPQRLQTADVPLVSDASCGSSYSGFVAAVMTCALGQSPKRDACFGDSGGPLVVPDAMLPPEADVVRLLGIVSFGPPNGCGIAGYPGVYTDVGADEVHNYLSEVSPTSAPRTTSPPSLQGAVGVGSTITCNPGTWSGSPSFTYQFIIPTASGDVARTAQGGQSSYTIQPGDAGSALRCDVKGKNAGGLAFAESAAVTVPVPAQQPPVQPPNGGTSQVKQDTAAPVARITKTTCTATRCTLTVTVTDSGFSAGIKTVQSSVRSTYRSRCKRKGSRKTVACTKHRTIKPSVAALTSTRYKVVASKLPYGTQRFTIVAIDKAGHRQALPTTKTVTTKKPKKRR